jgi:hypothetical protein
MYVKDRDRWNKAKGIAAFGFFLIGLWAVGGLEETAKEPDYALGYIMLSFVVGLMWSIYRRR